MGLLAALVLGIGVGAGPATAPAGATEAEPPAAEEATPAAEPAGEAEENPGGEGRQKIQLPIDLRDPQGAVGALLLVLLVVAAALGVRNAVQQLRGERPQADGSWRPR